MKAIVHIGAPKTGSSSIQAFLKINRPALRKQGFRIGLDCITRASHADVPIAALARIGQLPQSGDTRKRYGAPDLKTAKVTLDKVAADLAAFPGRYPDSTLIITAEYILAWLKDVAAIKSLDEMLSAHFSDVIYVMYLRSPGGLILSAYSERIKRGRGVAQDEFVKGRLTFFDQYADVCRWVEAVGASRFKTRLLETDFLTDGDLIADFSGLCGIKLDGLALPERMNESLTAEAVEVLKVFNKRVPQIVDVSTINPVSRGVMRRVMAHPQSKTPIRLTAEQAASIVASTAESTEKLRAAFFPDRPLLYTGQSKVGVAEDQAQILARALEIAVDLFVDQRSGKWGELDEDDLSRAKVRNPADAAKTAKGAPGQGDKARRKARRAGAKQAKAASGSEA